MTLPPLDLSPKHPPARVVGTFALVAISTATGDDDDTVSTDISTESETESEPTNFHERWRRRNDNGSEDEGIVRHLVHQLQCGERTKSLSP